MARGFSALILFFAFVVCGHAAFAQGDVPPNAEAGKCYARCYIPDEYGFIEQEVQDKPASKKVKVIAAEYKTVKDTIVVKPARKKLQVIPATFETVREQVMVEPARTEWVKGKADPGCLSENPEDCQVMCLVELPATYKTISRKIIKTPARTDEIDIPAELKIVEKRVLVRPASTQEINIPATYKTELRRVITNKGGYSEWREILCSQDINTDVIRKVQEALTKAGYNPGPIDNILGNATKEALRKYQLDRGLPVSTALNLETLKALGVNY